VPPGRFVVGCRIGHGKKLATPAGSKILKWPSFPFRDNRCGVKIHVRATPNAKASEIIGWEDDPLAGRVLRVRVAAPPTEGKANAALRDFLAKSFGLSKSAVVLEKGGGSRFKVFTLPDGVKLPG